MYQNANSLFQSANSLEIVLIAFQNITASHCNKYHQQFAHPTATPLTPFHLQCKHPYYEHVHEWSHDMSASHIVDNQMRRPSVLWLPTSGLMKWVQYR